MSSRLATHACQDSIKGRTANSVRSRAEDTSVLVRCFGLTVL